MSKPGRLILSAATFSLLLSLGVARAQAQHHHPDTPASGPTRAIAVLQPTAGSSVRGVVVFTITASGVRVVADVTGLSPGRHGFHVHEFGDCSAPDGTSAGGHFNPSRMPHSSPAAAQRHAGDLGNLVAGADGKAHLDWTDSMLRLEGPETIIGRSVVVHEKEDDLKTQPTGNAGPRVAVGVVGIARPEAASK